jgi:hypothetical protein
MEQAYEFLHRYAENSVNQALNILLRIMERNLIEDPDENEEKVELACSAVNFLKAMTCKEGLRKEVAKTQIGSHLSECLALEERYLPDDETPIEIERIWSGRNNTYLFTCMTGKDSVFPYRNTGLRILLRLCDNFDAIYDEA